MPITHDFTYHRPATLAEALELLSRAKGKGCVLAGGTDLINEMKDGLRKPGTIVDIKALPGIGRLELQGSGPKAALWIGAGVTFGELLASPAVRRELPVLAEAAATVGSQGLRNRATLVGNVCSAVPCLDSGPPLLVYEAEVAVASASGEKFIPIARFITGPRRTLLKPGELVTGVRVPLPGRKHAGCYVKLGRYTGEDLAQASVAVLALTGKSYRVAFGSVGPAPRRARKLEGMLQGKALSPALLEKVGRAVAREISPITDVRATKEYRQRMCQVMLERGLEAAAARLAGKGPRFGAQLL
jgi:CO/xanthine dehydrogenase FAD-binding subunit